MTVCDAVQQGAVPLAAGLGQDRGESVKEAESAAWLLLQQACSSSCCIGTHGRSVRCSFLCVRFAVSHVGMQYVVALRSSLADGVNIGKGVMSLDAPHMPCDAELFGRFQEQVSSFLPLY